MAEMQLWRLGTAGLALVVASCSLRPVTTHDSDYDVLVTNGTTLELTVLLNGMVAGTYPAGTSAIIPAAGKPPRPWQLNVLTTGSRSIVTMDVAEASVGCTEDPDGSRACSGVVRVLDLSCGRFVIAVSPTPPELPAPVPGAGEPGDCEP